MVTLPIGQPGERQLISRLCGLTLRRCAGVLAKPRHTGRPSALEQVRRIAELEPEQRQRAGAPRLVGLVAVVRVIQKRTGLAVEAHVPAGSRPQRR
jgi:hypothetical protein